MKRILLVAIFAPLCALYLGAAPSKKITVYTIGDSTMADKDLSENNPERGWGQALPLFVSSRKVQVKNFALNGRSSKSFRDEGVWDKVFSELKKGDYVFIQFGHNDSKPDSARFTDPETTFKRSLAQYVNQTRAKGAHPVLFTSIIRRKFDESGKLVDTHGAYVSAVRELAREMHIPLIDMNRSTHDYIEPMGEEASRALFMWVDPGVTPRHPNGAKDDTHLNEKGAKEFARLAVEGIKEIKLPVAKYFDAQK